MTQTAITIKNISKKYVIGDTSSGSLGESITNIFRKKKSNKIDDFWALKDISFNVEQGEAIGIIGKNGAGKSTLLKILSKITEPTKGRIEINGRVSSLLEVGTGFHPELTGLQNVFLNGTILGMKRNEIKDKLDEIVDFSGVGKFLDTPIKRYSSGMKVRLAFAVAAFLEPEILIIDEVLAVGDIEFQRKCLGKMQDVTGQGRTVLFVSHNISAVKNLCKSGVLLDNGKIAKIGEVESVAQFYQQDFLEIKKHFNIKKDSIRNFSMIPGFITRITIEDAENIPANPIKCGQSWKVRVEFSIKENIKHFVVGLGMTTAENLAIGTSWSKPQEIRPGKYQAIFSQDTVFYTAGKYKLIVGLSSRESTFHYVDNLVVIEFEEISDKSIIVNSKSGLVLNQMNVTLIS